MFKIEDDGTINVTRGDMVSICVDAEVEKTGEKYTFSKGDILRIKIFGKKKVSNVFLEKSFVIEEETPSVDLALSGNETKFGEIINKPKDYWYEVELNPETEPQTIIGYDDEGPKIFRLYPEGADL